MRIKGRFLHEREFLLSPRGRFDPGVKKDVRFIVGFLENNILIQRVHVRYFRIVRDRFSPLMTSLPMVLMLSHPLSFLDLISVSSILVVSLLVFYDIFIMFGSRIQSKKKIPAIMVNRGWVPRAQMDRETRLSSEEKGEVTIEAIVRKTEGVSALIDFIHLI